MDVVTNLYSSYLSMLVKVGPVIMNTAVRRHHCCWYTVPEIGNYVSHPITSNVLYSGCFERWLATSLASSHCLNQCGQVYSTWWLMVWTCFLRYELCEDCPYHRCLTTRKYRIATLLVDCERNPPISLTIYQKCGDSIFSLLLSKTKIANELPVICSVCTHMRVTLIQWNEMNSKLRETHFFTA